MEKVTNDQEYYRLPNMASGIKIFLNEGLDLNFASKVCDLMPFYTSRREIMERAYF